MQLLDTNEEERTIPTAFVLKEFFKKISNILLRSTFVHRDLNSVKKPYE